MQRCPQRWSPSSKGTRETAAGHPDLPLGAGGFLSRLNQRGRDKILAADQVLVSAASIWEAVIKSTLGKLRVEPTLLVAEIARSGLIELPVTARHAAVVANLPMHHKDPFDRLLVAQALTEPARLLTSDAMLARYTELVDTV